VMYLQVSSKLCGDTALTQEYPFIAD